MNKTQPLYIKAKNKSLGELQTMDIETLEWIEKESSFITETSDYAYPKLSLEDFKVVEALIPLQESFLSSIHYNSIHGLSHILRVMFISVLLCKILKIDNYLPYLISASIHDIRRINDNQDSGHGLRAKDWFLSNKAKFLKIFTSLTNQDLLIIAETASWHETDYNDIPELILSAYKTEIDIFKACDALDRYRQPKEKWWTNPEFVELKEALVLIPIARAFTIESEKLILDTQDIQESVITIAKKLFYDKLQ